MSDATPDAAAPPMPPEHPPVQPGGGFVPAQPPRAWRLRAFVRSLNPFTLLLGPVFQREIRVTGRRKGTYAIRFLVLAIPTFVVALQFFTQAYVNRYADGGSVAARIQSMQNVAFTIAAIVLWCQLITLTLAAPLLTAGAVVEERTARTLSAIAASPLKPGAFIGGVFTSRIVNLSILAMLPVPILLAIRAFGGLDTAFVLAGFSIAVCSATAAASLGVWTSTRSTRTAAAVSAAAMMVLLHWLGPILVVFAQMVTTGMRTQPSFMPFLFSPPAALGVCMDPTPGAMLGMSITEIAAVNCLFSLAIAGGALLLARRRLARLIANDQVELVRQPSKRKRRGAARSAQPADSADAPASNDADDSRTVTGNPILWRELRQPLFAAAWKRWLSISLTVVVVLAVHFFTLNIGRYDREPLIIIPSLIGLALLLLSAAAVPAGSITTEREAQTWATLLTSPLRPMQILLPKLAGAIRRLWPAYLFVLLHLSLCVLRGLVSPMIIPFAVVHFTVFAVFLCTTGVVFSLWCRKSAAAATLNLVLALALWMFVPICTGILLAATNGRDNTFGWLFFSNPFAVFVSAMIGLMHNGRFEMPELDGLSGAEFTTAWLFVLGLYAAAGVGVLLMARTRFHKLSTARL
ncbi:MAG: ABC transporter permease subunit [Phycisphaerales bacterium]